MNTSKHRDPKYKGRIDYDDLQFDLSNPTQRHDENRYRIFTIALHLMDCLEPRLQRANLTIYSRTFRSLVATFGRWRKRDFDGISVEALVTLCFQIVNAKRCLDSHLAISTPSFTPTHLYKIAGRIVGYDNEIRKVKEAGKAIKDRKPVEASKRPLG